MYEQLQSLRIGRKYLSAYSKKICSGYTFRFYFMRDKYTQKLSTTLILYFCVHDVEEHGPSFKVFAVCPVGIRSR